MKINTEFVTRFWQWLTGRSIEMEHIGMGAVILISTWHVSQHMHGVEGSAAVAVIMGAVLGFLNAVFAMRFFEERQETRWPAGVGVLFFAGVSVWMQYGFYAEQSDLVPYMLGRLNVNALAFGAWAPAAEILLGWLYGVRLFGRGIRNNEIARISADFTRQLADLQAKFDRQLTINQELRDSLHTAKTDGQTLQSVIADKDALIDDLRSKLSDLRVQKATLDGHLSAVKTSVQPAIAGGNQPRQLTGKLTTDERRAVIVKTAHRGYIDEDGEQKPITRAGLARLTNAAVNTIKSDLEALQAERLITVNGTIKATKAEANT